MDSKKKLKIISSGIVSNFLEFYDFALFAVFTVHFCSFFFPVDQFSALISTLSIFGIAFCARPFGSIFFGYIGDHIAKHI